MELIKLISLIIYLICACGCYFQVHFTSIEYFKYQTTTRISIESVDKFIPPDFTICYWLDYIIDAKKVFNETGKDISGCTYTDIECMTWFYNHSMSSIIHNFTYDLESRLSRVKFETAEGRAPIFRTYYRYQHKCIRISFGRTLISRSEMSHLSLDFSVYGMTLRADNVDDKSKFEWPFIIIHEAEKLADLASTRGIRLDLLSKNAYVFKYKLVKEMKLGLPYQDCINYRNYKHSKSRCMEECLTREYSLINRTNVARTTWSLDFNIVNELSVLQYAGIKYFEPKPGIISLRKKCNNACKVECIKEQYYPSILSATKAPWVAKKSVYLEVQANEPVTTIRSVVYFTLLDYFTYLISMPGAWIGISVSSVLYFLVIDTHEWFKKYFESNDA